MPSYLKELAPWESKSVYYQDIQLGKDVKTQLKIINEKAEVLIAAQIASTDEIISSRERIAEGTDKIAYGIENVAEGMYGLKAAFEWGISEVVWQIEQNRRVLKSILEVLIAPLDTLAKELRRRAEEAYANGWFEEALEDFLESEKKNKYDFLVHISIGMIYLFQKIDKEKSLEYFEKAIKYGKPKSPYHTSFTLLHKALIKRDYSLIEEAEKCTDEAVKLCPDFAAALYQNALYNSLLNNPNKAAPLLKKAIKLDVNYCEKIHNEKAFDKIRVHINTMNLELREEQKQKSMNQYTILTKKLDAFNNLINEIRFQESLEIHDDAIKYCIGRITELIRRNSYRDYLEANNLLNELSIMIQKLCSNVKTQLEKLTYSYNSKINEIKYSIDSQTHQDIKKIQLVWKIGIPAIIFLGLVGCFLGAGLFQKPSMIGTTTGTLTFWGWLLGTPLFGFIIVQAVYLTLYSSIRLKTKHETSHIESAKKRLQDVLSEIENL